jgi:hypothetical protein
MPLGAVGSIRCPHATQVYPSRANSCQ